MFKRFFDILTNTGNKPVQSFEEYAQNMRPLQPVHTDLPNIQLTDTGATVTSNVEPERKITFGERLTNNFLGNKAQATDNIAPPQVNSDGGVVIDSTISQNPRVGGIFPDIAAGFKENLNNPININNFGQNELGGNRRKGLAYRLGEGLGSLARLGESPLGRGLLMAGIVGATGGSGLQALAYGAGTGVGNQANRMRDRAYRDDLIRGEQETIMGSEGFDKLDPTTKQMLLSDAANRVNNYRGYITNDVYRNMVDSRIARENAAYRRMYYDNLAKQGAKEAELAQDKLDYTKKQDAIKNAQEWKRIENDKNKKSAGRIMPAASATNLSGTQQGIQQMETLMGQIPKYAKLGLAGPVGSLRRFNPYDANAQAFQQYVNTYKQVIGKGLEGGVLRKEDEAKYEKIIPRMGDTEEVLMRKAQQLQQMLINKYNTDLEALYNAGYDTGNFNYWGNMQQPKDSLGIL